MEIWSVTVGRTWEYLKWISSCSKSARIRLNDSLREISASYTQSTTWNRNIQIMNKEYKIAWNSVEPCSSLPLHRFIDCFSSVRQFSLFLSGAKERRESLLFEEILMAFRTQEEKAECTVYVVCKPLKLSAYHKSARLFPEWLSFLLPSSTSGNTMTNSSIVNLHPLIPPFDCVAPSTLMRSRSLSDALQKTAHATYRRQTDHLTGGEYEVKPSF